ncbi:MAG: hypothetical protein GF398_15820 [Chitinivibrionales bacterium]|nr:hypothetical protein [Chitinivibrionales bacterium]
MAEVHSGAPGDRKEQKKGKGLTFALACYDWEGKRQFLLIKVYRHAQLKTEELFMLSSIRQIGYPNAHSSSARSGKGNQKKNPASPSPRRDSYVPTSASPGDTNDRAGYLEQIRKKIDAGYYNTESVVDDLSHGFAKAFHKSL